MSAVATTIQIGNGSGHRTKALAGLLNAVMATGETVQINGAPCCVLVVAEKQQAIRLRDATGDEVALAFQHIRTVEV